MKLWKKYVTWAWVLAAAGTVLIDLFLKRLALERFSAPTPLPEGSLVIFGLHKNPGILFDIPVPQPLLWILTLMLIVILARMASKEPTKNPHFTLGAIITIFGALGNLIDRMTNGFTTDYLLFFIGSAINLSDIVIVVGLLLILFAKHRESMTPSSTCVP